MFKIDWRMYYSSSRISYDSVGFWLYVRHLGAYHEVPLLHTEQTTLGMDGVL